MDSIQSLHYALGQMAYIIASADGQVQKEEQKKFHDMMAAELRCRNYDFDVSDIIFQVLEKEKITNVASTYDWAMKEIRTNSHYLSPELKATFIKVMEKVARAYPPVTIDEKNLLDKFKEDIAPLKGDPVYYEAGIK